MRVGTVWWSATTCTAAAGIDLFAVLDDVTDQDRMLTACAAPVPLSEVRLLAPVLPPTVRDFVTFEEHVEGVRRSIDGASGVPEQWYAAPTFYFTNPYSIRGPADDVPVPPGRRQSTSSSRWPLLSGGRAGSDAGAGARRHRRLHDLQRLVSARPATGGDACRAGPAKGKDTATTLGPWLVTADELEPYRNDDGFLDLELTAAVNGTQVGHDRLSHMGWTFEEMVAYASRGTWVRPGDVLGSGTCGNGGCLAELWGRNGRQDPPPLQPGDVVTLTVEGIGSLTNTIVAGVAPVLDPRRPAPPRAALKGHRPCPTSTYPTSCWLG